MATTTKTLTPTNQTITLPDMTERPDASVLVDGIGKDADAINALSDQIGNLKQYTFMLNHGTSKTISFSAGCWCFLSTSYGAAASVSGVWLINGSNSNPRSVVLSNPQQVSITDGASNITITNSHSSANIVCNICVIAENPTITIS